MHFHSFPPSHWNQQRQVAVPSVRSCAVGAGVNGYVTNLPSSYEASFALMLSDTGINGAMEEWGKAMQQAHGTKRMSDVSSTTLTYWTDNGAYYDFYAYEPDINSKGLVEDIFIALEETFTNGTYPGPALPVHHYMLDAYWMYNVRSNCNCKLNDTVWPVPFPHGLEWLAAKLGNKSFIIYNGPQCVNSTYTEEWPMIDSLFFDVGWARGVLSIIAGSASFEFYSTLFSRKDLAMLSFTQDFLDFNYLLFPVWLESSDGNHAWLAGQAQAGMDTGITIQYCMALPSDLLESLMFPAVTNARASNDYGAGGDNWKIGATSLLLWAVNLRASKDNFWSGSKQTDRGRESSPYLQAVVCALSMGPVGFADSLNLVDPDVLWPTMRADGKLLHPSRPATTIDGVFLSRSAWADSDVRVSSSTISNHNALYSSSAQHFYSVLVTGAAALSVPTRLTYLDLYPLHDSVRYWMWQFNNIICSTEGSPASDCLIELKNAGHARETTLVHDEYGRKSSSNIQENGALGSSIISNGTTSNLRDSATWSLWTCSPEINGLVLLGEVAKYVSISPDRFLSITPTSSGIHIELVGAQNESVRLAYVNFNTTKVVHVVDVILDSHGSATVAL